MIEREFASIGAATSTGSASAAGAQHPIRVFAAGSLRGVMAELALALPAGPDARPRFEFGASGLLRDRILQGDRPDVFASANLEHPQAHTSGR